MEEAEQDPLTRFLSATCKVPHHLEPLLRRHLSRKFHMAIVGKDHKLRSATAISIYRATIAAYQLGLLDLTEYLNIPGLDVPELKKADLTCPKLAAEHNVEIAKVVKELEDLVEVNQLEDLAEVNQLEDLAEVNQLEAVAARFHLRIRVYLLKETWQKLIISSGPRQSLTCYLFVHSPYAAALVPKKHCVVMKLPTSKENVTQKAAFLSRSPQSPPKVSRSLQVESAACVELLRRLHSTNEPVLQFIHYALLELSELQDKPQAKAIVKRLSTVLKAVEPSDQSPEILEIYHRIRLLLNSKCETCDSNTAQIALPCGHNFCLKCFEQVVDFVDLYGTTSVPIACSSCGTAITVDDLKSLSPETYAKAVEAIEARCQLRLCAGCSSLHSLSTTAVLACGHRVCGYCQATSCPVCHCPASPLPSFQCSACGREFPYAAAVPYTCISSSAQLRHSEYCNNCLLLAESAGRCCEHHELTPEERKLITTRAEMVMFDCHKAVGSKRFIVEQKCCSHLFCEDCVIMYSAKGMEKLRCTDCNINLTDDVLERLAICCVCSRPRSELHLRCGHSLHTDCLPQLMEESHGENCVRCKTCDKYISPTDVLLQVDHKSQLYADFNDAFGYSFELVCPGGKTHAITDSAMPDYMFQCECQAQMICPYCLEPAGDNEHSCHLVAARKMVDELLESGCRVCQCPNCLQPEEASSDESQKCKACGCCYTPCCSAFYDLIYYHGAEWHRPECSRKSSQPPIGNQAECLTCKNSEHREPKQLKRPRLIGPGEI